MNKRTISPDRAHEIALNFVRFLAQDESRLDRFLQLTGCDLGTLKAQLALQDSGFLGSVLDYAVSDESLLLQFAAEQDVPPEQVATAHIALISI